MATIKSFTEKEIRAVRGTEIGFQRYRVHTEVLVNGSWIIPYLVQEEHLKWYSTEEKLRPVEAVMKEYLKIQFKNINELLNNGYELVDYNKYKEVIHKYHNPIDYTPKIIYL